MLSELPQYNDKITIAHAMTPPVVLKHNHPLVPRSMETVNRIAVSSIIAFLLEFFVFDHVFVILLIAFRRGLTPVECTNYFHTMT